MGSGKSTIGRLIAKKIDSYFLDTDSLIEHYENREISEIFKTDGEEYFRDCEKRVFEWITKSVKNSVVSTGGGLPMFVPQIKQAGVVIYLKVEFNDIVSRLTQEEISKRPLFQDLNQAKSLFDKRDEVYTKLADYIIENKSLNETLNKILSIKG